MVCSIFAVASCWWHPVAESFSGAECSSILREFTFQNNNNNNNNSSSSNNNNNNNNNKKKNFPWFLGWFLLCFSFLSQLNGWHSKRRATWQSSRNPLEAAPAKRFPMCRCRWAWLRWGVFSLGTMFQQDGRKKAMIVAKLGATCFKTKQKKIHGIFV